MDIAKVIQNLNSTNKSATDSTLKIELEKSYSARLSGLTTKQPSLSIGSGQQQISLPIPHEAASKMHSDTPYKVSFSLNSSNQLVANLFKASSQQQNSAFNQQLSQLQPAQKAAVTQIPLTSQLTFALLKTIIPANQHKPNELRATVSTQKNGEQIKLGGANGITLNVPTVIKPLINAAQPTSAKITENNGKLSAKVPVSKQGEKGPTHTLPIPKQQAEQWLQKITTSPESPTISLIKADKQGLQITVNGKSITLPPQSNLMNTTGELKIADGKLQVLSPKHALQPNTSEKPFITITVDDNGAPTDTKHTKNTHVTPPEKAPQSKAHKTEVGKSINELENSVRKLTTAVKQIFSKDTNLSNAAPPPPESKISTPRQQMVLDANALMQKIQNHNAAHTPQFKVLIEQLTTQTNRLQTATPLLTADAPLTDAEQLTKQSTQNSGTPHMSTVPKKSAIPPQIKQMTTQLAAYSEGKQSATKTNINDTIVADKPIDTGSITNHKSTALHTAVKQQLMDNMVSDDLLNVDVVKENINQQLNHTLQPLLSSNANFASTVALALQALLGKRLQQQSKASSEKPTENTVKATLGKEDKTQTSDTVSDTTPTTTQSSKPAATNKETLMQLQKMMENIEGAEEKLQKTLLGLHQSIRGQQVQNLERANDQLLHLQLILPLQKDNESSEVHIEIREENNEADNNTSKIWQVTLTFDLPKLGKLLATAKLNQDEVDIKLYSEQSDALKKAKKYTELLTERLIEQGLSVSAIHCSLGKIPDRAQKNSVHLLQVKV